MSRLVTLENLERFKINLEQTYGRPGGMARIDETGCVPAEQIPEVAKNVKEFATKAAFPNEGLPNQLYLDLSTNNLYRWDSDSFDYVSTSSPEGVKYIPQQLTNEQKQQARTNIGAISAEDVPPGNNVQYVPQTLTQSQQTQARTNISSASTGDISRIDGVITQIQGAIQVLNDNVSDVFKVENGIRIEYGNGSSKIIEMDTDFPIKDVVYDDDHYLHFYDENGDDFLDPVFIQGGGGGGTVGSLLITRLGNESVTAVYGAPVIIPFNVDAKDASGDPASLNGSTWYVGGIAVAKNIPVVNGNNSFNIGPYLAPGENVVKISVSAETGGEKPQIGTKSWSVNSVNMRFEWNYNNAKINTTSFTDIWTVYGSDILKTSHTSIDGVELDTTQTTKTNATQTITIPMQSHGAHAVEKWVTATVDNEPQLAGPEYREMIFVEEGNMTPIISMPIKQYVNGQQIPGYNVVMDQYDTIRIPVIIYDPASITTNATLSIDGTPITVWENVDRTLQYWSYTPTTDGPHTLSVQCGNVTKQITINVNEVQLDIEEIGGYSFRFKSSDFASNNAVRAWNSNGVTATFSNNFDWINGGLQTEEDENENLQQYVCIKAGTRMTINHKLFAADPKEAGMTFKIIYKVKNCRDYDASVGHCFSSVGVRLNAHQAIFNSSGTSINVPYSEDDYLELEFDVYPNSGYRYMMAWLDGVITSCRVYDANDSFVQSLDSQEDIILGSDDCDVYIYMVKAYPMLVSRDGHINNFIMDAPNASEMAKRYKRNNILNEGGEIDYNKLITNNPDCRVWLYDIPYMTNDKSDKVSGCKFNQFWADGDQYYQISGEGKMCIQGTSSVTYMRGCANTDINFSKLEDGYGNNLLADGVKDDDYGGNYFVEDDQNPGHAKVFVVEPGAELGPDCIPVEKDANRNVTKYVKALGMKLNDDSCPISYSNTKVNFASCEQVNNMCNAAWYQRFNPYPSLTARDCMEFNMGVQFMKDTGEVPDDAHFVLFGDDKYHMYSIANMGNSKKNVHVLHDLSNPNETCIEVNDNNAEQMRMVNRSHLSKQEYFAAEDWGGKKYYGMRYPDTKNPRQEVVNAWYDFVWWMATSDPNEATNEPLSEPETYGVYTFRGHDREGLQVLRGTTVKQYAGTYTHDTFERRMAKMLSECEDHMVMDSFMYHYVYLERHTMVDNVSKNNFWSSTDLVHWDLSKAYDMDTSDGNNNQGQLVFDYGNEWDDTNPIDGKMVFNGGDSVWFVFCANLYEACQTMFTNREAVGAWSATGYHDFLLTQQHKVPERCWVQCYWYDYLRTYEQGISDEWMTFLDGGQKTHQRKHYETFEELYDASKYRGSVSTSSNVNFRAYKPSEWAGVEPKAEITITMYNKMYISLNAGTTAMEPIKAQRGVAYTIPFPVDVDVGGTQVVVYTAPMIQAISGMEQLYPDTCVFSMAYRLRSLKIGSTEQGYQNTFLKNLALGNNIMLERLEVQNLPNANSSLDLSNCPALKYLDAQGSGFTAYNFANGGSLETAIINRPTSLNIVNLSRLSDASFTIADYSALIALRYENTPLVDSYALAESAQNLQIVRLIGINWMLLNTVMLNRMLALQGMNEQSITVPQSVLAGSVYVPSLRQRELDSYNAAWELNVNYDNIVEEFRITFSNPDGTTIKDRRGNNYVQYVDRGQLIQDPVLSGEIDTPTMEPTSQYTYTFTGWSNITGEVMGERNVVASYQNNIRTYRVRWFSQTGRLLKTVETQYGTEVIYEDELHTFPPVKTDEEGNLYFSVFENWDKSTGFITEDTDVYAIWTRAPLPSYDEQHPENTKNLKNMNIAEIYGVAKTNRANVYFGDEDYTDIRVGKDFNFSNVESAVLLENRYFNGEEIVRMENIRLFDENSPSFTMAIDYEYCDTTNFATLVSCCDATGIEGFKVVMGQNESVNVVWGDRQETAAHGRNRGILVLRHRKGSKNLYIASDNGGRYVEHTESFGGDDFPSGSWQDFRYDGYNPNILAVEIPRAQETHTNSILSFGAVAFGEQGYSFPAKGWIHWCKIWYADLGVNVIKELASWPHETWRMHYRGRGLYNKDDGTGLKDSASFIANAPLSQYYEMYPSTQQTTEGGWKNSVLRSFVNTRCYNALPYCWQSIIKPVSVVTKGGADNAKNFEYTTDKIYVPAYADMSAVTGDLSVEGTQVTWFIDNASRIKFIGITKPENAQLITDINDDPTLYVDTYTVHEGDIWIPPVEQDRAYIYVGAETMAKHSEYGGRYMDDTTNNFIAQGTQGGIWIRSRTYWTRTNNTTTATTGQYYQYTVYPRGNISSNTNIMYQEYQRRGVLLMFSI